MDKREKGKERDIRETWENGHPTRRVNQICRKLLVQIGPVETVFASMGRIAAIPTMDQRGASLNLERERMKWCFSYKERKESTKTTIDTSDQRYEG